MCSIAGSLRQGLFWAIWLVSSSNLAVADTFLIKSEDGGRSWSDADPGPPHYLLLDLKSVPGTSTIYALTQTWSDGYRVLVSNDEGQSWRVLDKLSVRGSLALGIAVQPGSPDVLYLAKAGPIRAGNPAGPLSLMKTSDAGKTVFEFHAGGVDLPGGFLNGRYHQPRLAAFVSSPTNVLYASTLCDEDIEGAECPERSTLWKSSDGGHNWTPQRQGFSRILFDPSDEALVYLLPYTSEILSSSDGGQTWSSTSLDGCRQAIDLAVDFRDSSVLTALCIGTETVLYRSADKGATWERRHRFANDSESILGLAIHPQDSSIIYAGGANAIWPIAGRILRSDDAGVTFTKIVDGPPFSGFNFLIPGPGRDTIFAGSGRRFEFVFDSQTVFMRDILGLRRIAPGSLASIYGTDLAPESRNAEAPLPDSLLGVRVRFDGRPAPLLFVSPRQINLQVPFGIEGPVVMEVGRPDGALTRQTVLAWRQAAVILTEGPGSFVPFAFHGEDFRRITASDPARPGEVISFYCLGLGELRPAIAAGRAPTIPPPTIAATPLIQLWGPPVLSARRFLAEVLWAGAAPELIGVYQVNVRLPASLVTGLYTMSIGYAQAEAYSLQSNGVVLDVRQ